MLVKEPRKELHLKFEEVVSHFWRFRESNEIKIHKNR